MTLVLQTKAMTAGYGPQPVVHDLDIKVSAGEVVTLLGANGAGKTTTLLALSGVLPLQSGEVLFNGKLETGPLHRRARQGLGYVTEERSVLRTLSLIDNLRCGRVEVADALALFPELEKRLHVRGGLLSGGEQQMLTLSRALCRKPNILLVDEMSLGLAPLIVERLLKAVRAAAAERGCGVLLVEQHARKALHYADRVYVMRRGRMEMNLTAAEARRRIGEIEASYLAGRSADDEVPVAAN
ncbi:MAG: putative high-affinity branched-chain amino acid transport protein superfamily, atp bind [Frankiales bacterium]|nr:putative high-affinity branched-chain amino acid transport protein superfamily, atp bind [Frankiales bacterium]